MSDNHDTSIPSPLPASERVKRAFSGYTEPDREAAARGGSVTIEERRKREAEIRACVKLGMTVVQMVEFLPTRGLRLSKSTIYEYLGRMKLPKNYKPAQNAQSHHDYFTLNAIIQIAKSSRKPLSQIEKGKSPGEGAGFRHDFSFEVGSYLFYGEMQLSDLAQTDWRKKAKNYVKWYRKLGRPFRVLFIVDQKGDMTHVRRHCREVLKEMGHPDLNLFYFLILDDLTKSDLAHGKEWIDAYGIPQSLIK